MKNLQNRKVYKILIFFFYQKQKKFCLRYYFFFLPKAKKFLFKLFCTEHERNYYIRLKNPINNLI